MAQCFPTCPSTRCPCEWRAGSQCRWCHQKRHSRSHLPQLCKDCSQPSEDEGLRDKNHDQSLIPSLSCVNSAFGPHQSYLEHIQIIQWLVQHHQFRSLKTMLRFTARDGWWQVAILEAERFHIWSNPSGANANHVHLPCYESKLQISKYPHCASASGIQVA